MTAALVVTLAAVAGAPHCLGMCGPLACAGSGSGGWLPYHVGRMVVYSALGGLAGAFGAALPGPGWLVTAVSAALLVGFSATLAGVVPEPRIRIPGLSRVGAVVVGNRAPWARFAFGMVNGLLPCGLLYATLAVPVSTGSASQGAALMALFAVLTAIPLTAAVFGLRALLHRRGVRVLLAALVLVTGLSSLAGRGGWFVDEPESCHATP